MVEQTIRPEKNIGSLRIPQLVPFPVDTESVKELQNSNKHPLVQKNIAEAREFFPTLKKMQIYDLFANPHFIAHPRLPLPDLKENNSENNLQALQNILSGAITKDHIDALFQHYPPAYADIEYSMSPFALYNRLELLSREQNVSDIDIIGFYFDEERSSIRPESLQRFLKENPTIFDFYNHKELIVSGALNQEIGKNDIDRFSLEEREQELPQVLSHFAKTIYGSDQIKLAAIIIDLLRDAKAHRDIVPHNIAHYSLLTEYANLIMRPEEEHSVRGEMADQQMLKKLHIPNLQTQPLRSVPLHQRIFKFLRKPKQIV